ncbi:uncharacterized protein MYCFIDRAFT_7388, partial [Pseudocercospora fijiensis CIRAD86]
ANMDEVKKIAQLGDLILEVGGSKAKLLVSSTVLTSLSKVFAALLGPHFKEGQVQRSAETPQVVDLPEDDAAAMTNMCMLLHAQSHRKPGIIPTADFRALATQAER